MKIKEEKILHCDNLPYSIELCNIHHARPHFHAHDLEIIFCLKGSVNIVSGHQQVHINAGEVFSLDYSDIHCLYSYDDNLLIIFHLDLTDLRIPYEKLSAFFFACESFHCYPYQEKAFSEIKDVLLALAYRKYAGMPGAREPAEYLINLFIKFFDWFNYENQTAQTNAELHDRFYRILTYCRKNYTKKISIEKLAEAEHINKNYFSQFFRGTPFNNFSTLIIYIRCYEAEIMLLTTDKPIDEISFECGFSDPKYLYKNFIKFIGMTPAEDRERYRSYAEKPEDITFIDESQAQDILREYIADWHIEKTLKLKALS